MNNFARFILRLYVPIAVAFVVLFFVIFDLKLVPGDPDLKIEMGLHIGVLGIQLPLATWLEHTWVIRGFFAAFSLGSLIWALSIDFSKYFPSILQMDVYFDVSGIERTLNLFSDQDLGEISLPENWRSLVNEYDEEVSSNLDTHWKKRGLQGTPTPKELRRELLNARGQTTFRVNKVGWLSYKIVESEGHLEFELDVLKDHQRRFRCGFYLRDTAANHIRPQILKLLRSPSVVLKPEFKQIFSIEEAPADAPVDHVLIGMTKVTLIPVPSFSNTVYLWKTKNGKCIPVAYAIYR